MISNRQFIKTHSFEIAWAVFRCAALFDRDKLRKEIESAAVDLMTQCELIDVDTEGEVAVIERLVALIRLAESIGQLALVNAHVLYREIGKLENAIKHEVADRREKRDIAPAIEQIFSDRLPHPLAEHRSGNASVQRVPVKPAEVSRQSTSGNSGIASFIRPSAFEQPGMPISHNTAMQSLGSTPIAAIAATAEQPTLAVQQPKPQAVATAVSAMQQSGSQQGGSWQHVILQKVKELRQTTTKELTANFPEISERTIRFYLQKLVDGGLIDRVGSTGPGAYYKAK